MNLAAITTFMAEVNLNVRTRPFTEEEQIYLDYIVHRRIPCARQRFRDLRFYIFLHLRDWTVFPLNKYRLVDVRPARNHYMPFCMWIIVYEFVDPNQHYSKATSDIARQDICFCPTNAVIKSPIKKIFEFNRWYWSLEVAVRRGTTECRCPQFLDNRQSNDVDGKENVCTKMRNDYHQHVKNYKIYHECLQSVCLKHYLYLL